MRHQDDPNVFTSEFLHGVERRDQESRTQFEASLAGPWSITEVDRRGYAVHRAEAPGEPPAAIFRSRETALLFAALCPLIGRDRLYRLSSATAEPGFEILTIAGDQPSIIGWLRRTHPELLEALHLAEGFLRSPTALAGLLEAASYEALLEAGRLLQAQLRQGERE